MSVQKKWMNDPMSFVTFSDEDARTWLRDAEDEECRRLRALGLDGAEARQAARARIAREIGAAPGTLENSRRGRLKGMKARIRDAVYACMLRSLQQKIQRAEHELEMALQCGAGPGSTEIIKARAAIVQARACFEEGDRLRRHQPNSEGRGQ